MGNIAKKEIWAHIGMHGFIKHYRSFFLYYHWTCFWTASRENLPWVLISLYRPSCSLLIRERHVQSVKVGTTFPCASFSRSPLNIKTPVFRKPVCCLGFILHPDLDEQDSLLFLTTRQPGLPSGGKEENKSSFIVHKSMVHGTRLQNRLVDGEVNEILFIWCDQPLTEPLTTFLEQKSYCWILVSFVFHYFRYCTFLKPTKVNSQVSRRHNYKTRIGIV